ncbi:MAG: hypothetical protein ACKO5J_15120 [Rubrivivax sp.]
MNPTAVRVRAPAPAAWPTTGLAPLTHHEILALVEPFVRAGLAPDMAASDRAARRVVFRACTVAPSGLPGLPPELAAQPLVESWTLDASDDDELGLTRELGWPQGPAARLEGRCPEASSEALAALLASMRGVSPGQLFVSAAGPGGEVALGGLTQRLAAPARAAAGEPTLVLKAAQAQLGGLTLRMSLSGVGGYPAEVELLRPSGAPVHLPHDLLAVLGRAWEPLTELSRGWVGRVTVRGEEPRRSREARARLGQMLAHLARTLAEPPPQFHARHRAARWGVVARGLTPWLVGLGVVAVALWARQHGGSSVLALLANVAPPLLMGLFFVRREMPRIALPRWPARLADDAWPVPARPTNPKRA